MLLIILKKIKNKVIALHAIISEVKFCAINDLYIIKKNLAVNKRFPYVMHKSVTKSKKRYKIP